MMGLTDQLSGKTHALAALGALILGLAIGAIGIVEPNARLAPLEIVPLALLAWIFPIWFGLAAALLVSWLFQAPLSVGFTYVVIVLLVWRIRHISQSRLATSEAELRAIGDAVPYGVWSSSSTGELLSISPSFLAMIGRTWEQERGFGWLHGATTERGREKLESWKKLAALQKPFEFERRVKGPDGRLCWILTRGFPLFDAEKKFVRYTGINLDITERKSANVLIQESEERYRYLAESIPQIVWICDAFGNIEYFNDRWYAYSGMRRGEPISGAFPKRIHPADRERTFKTWIASSRGLSDAYEAEVRLRSSDGTYRWFLSRAVPQTSRTGGVARWFGTSTDIDARKRAQDQLAFLARASEALSASQDVDGTCNLLAQLATPTIADWCGVYLLDPSGTIRTVAIAHDDAQALDRAWIMEHSLVRTQQSPGVIAATIRTGEIQSIGLDDPVARRAMGLDEEHDRRVQSMDFGATICVPMHSNGETIGAIILINRESQRAFEPADFSLAGELARRAAAAVENARAFDRERRVAEALQKAFLPNVLPRIPGLDFDAVYMPGVGDASIGGDWYDAFQLPDGRIALSIGDVAGRGLKAAVVMGRAREAIRSFALQDLSPREILMATERVLRVGDAATMVTAFVAIADPLAHNITFANAGHPPPLLANADGTIEALEAEGIPLGIFDDVEPRERSAPLLDDSLLVLYTDGLIEIDRDVVRGLADLRLAIAGAMRTNERTAAAIYRAVAGTRRIADDVAVLTLATQRLRREALELDLPAVPESARLVRAALERFADAYGLDADHRFALEVAVGEAVTNAIEHAYGIGPGRFAVRAREAGDALDIEIHDRGTWRAPRQEGRGRGVPIMRALARSVTIDSTEMGTFIRMTFANGVERNHST